jgi:hypothetical protein
LRFEDLPWLLELERLLPLLFARARSLCAELFWLLARAPLLPASERLILPPEREEDEEEELRDAIDDLLCANSVAPSGHPLTL